MSPEYLHQLAEKTISTLKGIAPAIRAAVLAEREACARTVEGYDGSLPGATSAAIRVLTLELKERAIAAAAIRARKD